MPLEPNVILDEHSGFGKKTEKRTSRRNGNRERKDIAMVYVGDIILLTKNT